MRGELKVRRFLLYWICTLSAVSYLDRTNISIAGVSIMKEFGIDQLHLGYIGSAFLIGYAGFQIPAGWLAGRFGPRLVLALGILWWCVFTGAITAISPVAGAAFWVLMAMRFVLGMGELVMYPSSTQFIAFWIPSAERGEANGWVFAGVGAGAGLTPPLVTWVMLTYGWRASFWCSALIGLVAALVWYLAARDRPENHPLVSSGELAHIKAGLPRPAIQSTPVPWRRIFASKDVWLVSIAYFSFGYVAFIFLNWFFIYLAQARGMNLKTSALYTMMPFIAMTVCCLSGGVASDWLTKNKSAYLGRCVFSFIALMFTALFLVLGSRAADPLLATITLAGGAGSLYVAQSPYWALSADFGGAHSGVVSGFMNMVCQIAGALTTTLTPFIAQQYGWSNAFYAAAGVTVVGAVAWLLVDPGYALAPQEQVMQ